MPERKFSRLSLKEIDRLSNERPADFALLSELLHEVRYRTDFLATGIQLAITKRLSDLERKTKKTEQNDAGRGKAKGPDKKANFEDPEITNLRQQLLQAQEQIAGLQARLKTSGNSEEDKLFRRVGLNKDCPDFVIRAVRTAYRKALHPDGLPAAHKQEAHRRFIDTEKTFEKLFELRKL